MCLKVAVFFVRSPIRPVFSYPDIEINRIGHYHVHGTYQTAMLPVHGVFPAADVSGLHLSG